MASRPKITAAAVHKHGLGAVPPRFVSRRTGVLKVPPPRLVKVFSCRECQTLLVWTGRSWCCPAGFHSKAIEPAEMLIRLKRAMRKYRRWTPAGLHRLYRCVSAWRSALEEHDTLQERRRKAGTGP